MFEMRDPSRELWTETEYGGPSFRIPTCQKYLMLDAVFNADHSPAIFNRTRCRSAVGNINTISTGRHKCSGSQ